MNVCFCCNDAWLPYVRVAVKSVLEHNDANVFIVTDSEDTIEGCTMIPLPDMSRIQRGKGLHFTEYAFIRLFLADILPVDKVIYLDADTLCLESLEELWDVDPECVAAVRERNVEYDYANTGVMVLNLKEFGRHKDSLINAINCNHFRYPDQDAINKVCKIQFIDNKWNYCVNMRATGECEHPAVIHYIWQKPWNGRCELSDLWLKYAGIQDAKELYMEKVFYQGKEYEVIQRSGADVVIKIDGAPCYVAGNLLGKPKAEKKEEPKPVQKKAPAKKK